jgi:hypothetical protein
VYIKDGVLEITHYRRENSEHSLLRFDSNRTQNILTITYGNWIIDIPTSGGEDIRLRGHGLILEGDYILLYSHLTRPFCYAIPLVQCLVLASLVDWPDLEVAKARIMVSDGNWGYFDVTIHGNRRELSGAKLVSGDRESTLTFPFTDWAFYFRIFSKIALNRGFL